MKRIRCSDCTVLIWVNNNNNNKAVAALDQAISTDYFKNKIFKEETDSKCWLCKPYEETIDHLNLGCCILVKNEYLKSHGSICAHFHSSLCKTFDRFIKKETFVHWTWHIVQKILKSETWSLSSEDRHWFKRSTNKKWPVTRDDEDGNYNNKNK